jgi:hypothetical protein
VSVDAWARLGWVLAGPLGIVQLVVAAMVERRLGRRPSNWIAVATQAALLGGIVLTALAQDRPTLVFQLSLLLYLPGLPLLIALFRARAWFTAVAAFILPPLPFMAVLRHFAG